VPKPDKYVSSVTVACEGPDRGTIRGGPGGARRSRDGAQLAHVRADAEYWHENFKATTPVKEHFLLVNPTRTMLNEALAEAQESLMSYRGEDGWAGGQIDFAFAGHGTSDGELVLADRVISASDLLDAMTNGPPTDDRRKLAFVFDSCHSGHTLAKVLIDERHGPDFLVIDAFAASLPDESAWELGHLGHGVLTFTMMRKEVPVDFAGLVRAVDEGDNAYLRLAFHAFAPNPVAYLTEGEQHSLDAINGHNVSVPGGGDTEVEPDTTLEELLAELRDRKLVDGATVS
jgi:Caspase domain